MITRINGMPLPYYAADGGGAAPAADGGQKPPAQEGAAPKGGDGAQGGDSAAAGKSDVGSALDLPKDGDEPKVTTPADWPEDWRDKLAAGDKEAAKALSRYKSPTDVAKALREAQVKISQGVNKPAPPPDGEKDPEGLAAWRKENGIPDAPDGYELPESVQKLLTDEDKPILANFTEFAHQRNMPPAVVAAATEWYTGLVEAQHAERVAADKADIQTTQDELRQEWGTEFKPNVTIARRFAEEITPGLNWFDARIEAPGTPMHGKKLGSIPDFVKALADLGTQKYGDVAFAGGENQQRTMSRKAEIERIMRTEPDKYTPELKKELFDILQAEEKRGSR